MSRVWPHPVRSAEGIAPVVPDKLFGPIAQHGPGQGIGEDRRVIIDDQVRGSGRRRGERGQAWFSVGYHARQITINYAYNNTKTNI